MKYIWCQRNNKDFILLCQRLDEYFNMLVGGEKTGESLLNTIVKKIYMM
jgi:hypothetical protein